jgi:hypothetical protein
VSVLVRQKALASVLMEVPHVLGCRPAQRAAIALLGVFAPLHLVAGLMFVSVQRSAVAPMQLQWRNSFSEGG